MADDWREELIRKGDAVLVMRVCVAAAWLVGLGTGYFIWGW